MRRVISGLFVLILVSLAVFVVGCGNDTTTEPSSSTSIVTDEPSSSTSIVTEIYITDTYIIDFNVPDQVITVRVRNYRGDVVEQLKAGVTEVAKTHHVKDAVPIQRPSNSGEATVAIVLFVEPSPSPDNEQVVFVKVRDYRGDVASQLSSQISIVGRSHNIKKAIPIIRPSNSGSATVALLLLIEPLR